MILVARKAGEGATTTRQTTSKRFEFGCEVPELGRLGYDTQTPDHPAGWAAQFSRSILLSAYHHQQILELEFGLPKIALNVLGYGQAGKGLRL